MPAALVERSLPTKLERPDLIGPARRRLEHHPHFRGRAADLSIEQHGRTLYLSGRLPTFYLKQLVQETMRHVPGVQAVRNEITVVNSAGISSER